MVYDIADALVVMFGGDDLSNDTWTYDIVYNKWANMNPPNAPAAGVGRAMAYDIAAGKVLLFGGGNWSAVFGDTWSYTYGTFLSNGNYTSRMYDVGAPAYFGSIGYTWESFIPPTTKVRFQFRSADTTENLMRRNFTGPDSRTNTFYDNNNHNLGSEYDGNRWFQYRAYFNSNDQTLTPVLRSVTVSSPIGAWNLSTCAMFWSGSFSSNQLMTLAEPSEPRGRSGYSSTIFSAALKARLASKKVFPEASSTLAAGEETERKTAAPARITRPAQTAYAVFLH